MTTRSQLPTIVESAGAASPAQADIWLAEELAPRPGSYNIPMVYRCADLVAASFAAALAHVVATYPTLRTRYMLRRSGDLRQEVLSVPRMPEVRHAKCSAELLPAAMSDAAWEPLSIQDGVNVRAFVFAQEDGPSIVLVVIHHLAVDDWSCGLVQQALWDAYEACEAGRPLVIRPEVRSFLSHCEDERRWLVSEEARDALAGLVSACDGFSGGVPGAVAAVEPQGQSGSAITHTAALSSGVIERALSYGRSRRCTPLVVGLAALVQALGTVAERRRIVICIAAMCRWTEDVLDTVGLISNLTPIAIDTSSCRDPADYLMAANNAYLASLEYARIPLRTWQEAIQSSAAKDSFTALSYGYSDASAWSLPAGVEHVRWTAFGPVRMPFASFLDSGPDGASFSTYADPRTVDANAAGRITVAWHAALTDLAGCSSAG